MREAGGGEALDDPAGLSRWPRVSFALPGANWQEHLAAAGFSQIAAAEVAQAFRRGATCLT